MNSEVSGWKTWLRANRVLVAVLFCTILLPMLVFGKIADEVVEREAIGFDLPIQLWAHSYQTSSRDSWMLAISMFGSPGLMALFCGVASFGLWMKKRRADLAFFLVATIGAGLLNQIGKLGFRRARPDLWTPIDPRQDFSFPSGHAMGTMALFAAILVLLWPTRWRVPFLILGGIFVFLVGLSRVYLGVHFPSDVLCGWLASLAWVLGLHLIRRSREKKLSSTRIVGR